MGNISAGFGGPAPPPSGPPANQQFDSAEAAKRHLRERRRIVAQERRCSQRELNKSIEDERNKVETLRRVVLETQSEPDKTIRDRERKFAATDVAVARQMIKVCERNQAYYTTLLSKIDGSISQVSMIKSMHATGQIMAIVNRVNSLTEVRQSMVAMSHETEKMEYVQDAIDVTLRGKEEMDMFDIDANGDENSESELLLNDIIGEVTRSELSQAPIVPSTILVAPAPAPAPTPAETGTAPESFGSLSAQEINNRINQYKANSRMLLHS